MGKQWCANVLVLAIQMIMILTARHCFPDEEPVYLFLTVGGVVSFCVGLITLSFYGKNTNLNNFIAQIVLAAATSFFLICLIALIKHWVELGGEVWQYFVAVFLILCEFISAHLQIVIASTLEKNRKNFVLKSSILAIPFGVSTVVGGVMLLRTPIEELNNPLT